jgi:hypothetical protein
MSIMGSAVKCDGSIGRYRSAGGPEAQRGNLFGHDDGERMSEEAFNSPPNSNGLWRAGSGMVCPELGGLVSFTIRESRNGNSFFLGKQLRT